MFFVCSTEKKTNMGRRNPLNPFLCIFIYDFSITHSPLSLPLAHHTLRLGAGFQERTFATIRTRRLRCLLLYANLSSAVHLKSWKIAGLQARRKERKEKSEERSSVSKQQLTLGAAGAAGWVPKFPCFCLRLRILLLRNLTCRPL